MAFGAAFWDAHYDAIYSEVGVEAALAVNGGDYAVTVVDKSVVARSSTNITLADIVIMHSARAIAAVRVSELTDNGLVRDDLNDAMITFNGATWRVKVTEPFPSPAGFDHGELYLILVDDGG